MRIDLLPARLLVPIACLLALPVAALAQPLLDVEITSISATGLPAEETWHAVAKVTISVVPTADDDTVELFSWTVTDNHEENWQYVEAVAFGIDVDGNSAWDPQVDMLSPDMPYASRSENQGVINGISAVVQDAFWILPSRAYFYSGNTLDTNWTFVAGEPVTWFVLYQFTPEVPLGAVFTPVFKHGDQFWEEPDFFFGGEPPHPWGGFVDGPELVLNPAFAFSGVAATANPLPADDSALTAGETDVWLGDYELLALPGGPYTVESMTFTPVGDPSDLVRLRVLEDTNGNQVPDESDAVLAASSTGGFATSVSIEPIVLNEWESTRVFVLGDYDAELKTGMLYGVTLAAFSFHEEGDSETGVGGGVPATSGTKVATPVLDPHLLVGFAGLTNAANGGGVAAAIATIDAIDTSVIVSGIELTVVGDIAAVTAVDVYHDQNSNGLFEPGENLVASASVSGSATVVALPQMAVVAGGRLSLLLQPVLAAAATGTEMFGFKLSNVMTSGSQSLVGLGATSDGITASSEEEENDPEFDPPPTGPFDIAPNGVGGCAAEGSGHGSTMLLVLLAAVAALMLVRRR